MLRKNPLVFALAGTLALAFIPTAGLAQGEAPDPATREAAIVAAQAEKARSAAPYRPAPAEAIVTKVDEYLSAGHKGWHPFLGSAYQGAGVTLGAGYMRYVGDYDRVDARASVSATGSKRVELEYLMPRLLGRRAVVSMLGGWREGQGVGFFGIGSAHTSRDDRTRFDFRQALGGVQLEVRPTRGMALFGGGFEFSKFRQLTDPESAFAQRYSAETLPGAGAEVTYLQSRATAALDSRHAAGYARRGGYYGVTARRFDDRRGPHSFRQFEVDAIQHVPVLRDAWVLSLRGRVETTHASDGDTVPFFMLPALGNGSTLRGFSSWRFRDRNSLLLSAEWRVLLNSVVDAGLFYDAGKVAARHSELNLRHLKSNYGIGFRIHTVGSTPIRVELARSNEGLVLVFATSAVF